MAKFINKKTCYIARSVRLGKDVIIYPNVVIEGVSTVEDGTIIYNGCYIKDSSIGKNNIIFSSHIINSDIGNNNLIGPYAYIRENNIIKDNVKVGPFVEVKNSVVDDNSKIPHLSYIGDAEVGKNVNIGCGVITANYDGKNKYQTKILDNAFIGCNSNLIARLSIGENAYVASGTTVTKDVNKDEFVIGRVKQENKIRRDL